MKKASPLKLIRIFAAVMLLLLALEFFLDEKYKTPLMVLRLITAVTLFVYAMFNSTAIEQEKIEKAKAN
jgi:hypothetical protein